jgi:hypothetical protein
MRVLQEHPDMWQRVDSILETSTNANSKFFALQVRRWCRGSEGGGKARGQRGGRDVALRRVAASCRSRAAATLASLAPARSPAARLPSERARLQSRAAAGAHSPHSFLESPSAARADSARASPGARERDQVPLDVAARRAARGHQELHRDRGDKGASAGLFAPGARTCSARSLRHATRCRATRPSSAATEHTSTS